MQYVTSEARGWSRSTNRWYMGELALFCQGTLSTERDRERDTDRPAHLQVAEQHFQRNGRVQVAHGRAGPRQRDTAVGVL
jgi:hypothetical protein